MMLANLRPIWQTADLSASDESITLHTVNLEA